MLTPKYLQRIIEATEKKASQLNNYLTNKVVDRILTLFENTGEINVNPASIHDMKKLESAGKLFDEVQEEIIRYLPIIQDEVRVAFMDASGKINKDVYDFTKHVIDVEHEKGELLDVEIPELPKATDFEKVGIPQSAADLNLTPKEIRMLESAYNRTNGEIYNITQTTAAATQQTFIDACDSAYWKVAHGVSPSTAITEAIEEVAAKGITTVHYGSREDKIEVAIARAVRTGINQANGDIKLTRCAEMGVGHVIVNSHIGARVTKHEDYTNHSLWQGKVYKLDWSNPALSKYQPTEQEIKENKKSFAFLNVIKQFFTRKMVEEEYEDFITVCGYGKMLGISGINCRHGFDPFVPGKSINTNQPIDSEKNRQQYELEQKQRAKEREIRELKRKKYAFDNAEPSDTQTKEAIEEKRKELKEKLTQKRAEYREFCKENRLSTENYRLQVAKAYGVSNSEVPMRSDNEYVPRTREEMMFATDEMKSELDKILTRKSKWSGNIHVDSNLVGGKKEWSCDITVCEGASDVTLRHELIHSYSVSYYDEKLYKANQIIEEASTELLAREMERKVKGFVKEYDKVMDSDVLALLRINELAKIEKTPYDWAVLVMNQEMPDRIAWIVSQVYQKDLRDKVLDEIYECIARLEGGYMREL